ncbi:MAG: DNA repair protein RecN [Chitinophagaceae bacterium]
MVDVHRQFDSMQIFQKYFQVSMIDALANNELLIKAYRQQYTSWKGKIQQLETLQKQDSQQKSELEYIQFLYEELAKANFQPQEIENLEVEIKQLENVERFQHVIFQGQQILNEGEGNTISQLNQLTNQIDALKAIFPELQEIQQRLLSSKIELQDMYNDIAHLGDFLKYDPQQVEKLQDRLSLGFQLLKKHKLQTTQQLLELKESFAIKLDAIIHGDSHITYLEKEVRKAEQAMLQLAEQISQKRQEKKPYFEETINATFQDIGMPNAKINLQIKPQSPNEYGIDDIEILFDSNGSGRLESIRKVASGGEMSRLMLCLKFLISDYMILPTMIFDEIDSGISGEVCKQVGNILETLSRSKQIICVTHQPQIAAKGTIHYFVYKDSINDSIHTHIKRLAEDERIKAIAEMISGENITEAALQHAKEMMKDENMD